MFIISRRNRIDLIHLKSRQRQSSRLGAKRYVKEQPESQWPVIRSHFP